MDLSPYLESLRRDLGAAVAAGGPEVARAGDLLAGALDPAARLALLDALSAAADEVTAALPHAAVEVRLRGRDPELVVTVAEPLPAEPAAPPPPIPEGEDGTARVTLRLPESLKTRVEEAAARDGVSVNSWLVRAVAGALEAPPRQGPSFSVQLGGRRITGYARG